MKFERSSGILLHPTSLPSKYGIGDIGVSAYSFVDFLIRSGQKIWQILPNNPVGYGESPYQCFSAFAGNPMMICIESLREENLLHENDLEEIPSFSQDVVEYEKVKQFKSTLFKKAYINFKNKVKQQEYEEFINSNKEWLNDYSFFMALKDKFSLSAWNEWPREIASREKTAMERYSEELKDGIEYHNFLQYIFFKQWHKLKKYANERKVKIVGDIPIFISQDSSDAWSKPHLFELDEEGNPTKVAGVPPDYFTKTGQLWGNPHFKWEEMKKDDFKWWRDRIEKLSNLVDIIRIDHFRGFEAYWEIPAGEKTAVNGRWVKAPGAELFTAIKKYLGDVPIIVEDLGFITPEVEKIKKQFNFPGMKILQFSFGKNNTKNEKPYGYEKNCVVYTGTHDNETTVGWYRNVLEKNRSTFNILKKYYEISKDMSESEVCWKLIELAYKTNANMVIISMQDILCLDNKARMNTPGTIESNWVWRYKDSDINETIENTLLNLCDKYKRHIPQD